MAIEISFPGALRYLEDADLSLFLSLGHLRSYAAGETFYAHGERVDRLFILEEGQVEVVRPDGQRYYLGPGDVVGAGLLAGAGPSEETVRALCDVAAIVLSPATLNELASEHAGAAARLCLGLVTRLAGYVRPPLTGEGPAVTRATETQRPSALSIPGGEEMRLGTLLDAARSAAAALGAPAAPPAGDEVAWASIQLPHVAPELDRLVTLLGAARGGDGAGPELLEVARAEIRPLLMRSRLAERMHERAPGEPARYRSLDHIYRNLPEGEDAAGLLLDAYLLQRPFAQALRERRRLLSDQLQEEVRRRAGPGRVVRVLSLGCGPARALADVLDQPGMSDLLALTCVDDDQEAIVFANNLLKGHAPRADLTLHQARPSDLSATDQAFRDFDVVASLFIADTLSTGALAATAQRAHEWLSPGGALILAAFSEEAGAADGQVTTLFLNWEPQRHARAALLAALRQGPFGEDATVQPSPTGLNLIVHAVKAS
jgi:hypothetical protein